MSADSGDGSDDDFTVDLPDSDEFWRLLLGRKYDNMSPKEKTDANLLDEIYRRESEHVDKVYGSKQGLVSELQADDPDEETVLLTVWAESKWQEKSPGPEFEFEDGQDITDEFERINETEFIVNGVQNNLFIIWTQKSVSRPQEHDESVRSYLEPDWAPLFAKRTDDELVEVRGRKRRQHQLSSEFAEGGKARKVQKEVSEKSVLDDVSSVFGEELDSLDLIEIRFRRSKLPDASQLTLRNDAGVQNDLQDDNLNPSVIAPGMTAEIEYIKFRDKRSDNIAKVNVLRQARGFSFELKANYISDEDTAQLKDLIETKFDISFEHVYPYHLQHQVDFILHQILSGSVESYDRYYEGLDDSDRELIDDFVEYTEESVYTCWECREEYDEKPDMCDECGSEDFDTESGVEVDDDEIYERVSEIFEEFSSSVSDEGAGIRLTGLTTSETEIGSSQYIQTNFQRVQEAGTSGVQEMEHYQYEYYVYPLANRKPQRVGQYLLDTVLVTYGTAYDRELENFGTISLIDLLRAHRSTEENDGSGSVAPEDLFLQAVERSHRRRQDRYRSRAKDAVSNLERLQGKVDTGELERHSDDDDDYQDDFLDDYSSKKFEKDVFYLLKSAFMFSERWGREGKKETDGLLVIPTKDDGYWVGGFDPKLTTDPKGYNINSSEKNKAAYYVLDESNKDKIKNTLQKDGLVDGHIFISDIFRDGQFSTTADRVQEWFSLIEGDDDTLDAPVIFLRISHLLDLYDIFESNYNYLHEYPGVMEQFRTGVVEELTTSEDHIEFDESSCESIRERVVRALDRKDKSGSVQNYSDDDS